MNFSIYSADRTTHLRIVTLSLVIGIAIGAFAISMRLNTVPSMHASEHTGRIQKVGTAGHEAFAERSARHPI
jgi:hypothetical protein